MSKSAFRTTAGIVTGAAVAFTAVAGVAVAQTYDRGNNQSVRERDRPELDPIGAPLGAFRLFPSATLSYENNSNVFAAETNEQSDGAARYGVGARIVSEWTRHYLEFNAKTDRRAYFELDDESTTDWSLGADGKLEVLRGLQIVGGIGTSKSHEPRGFVDNLAAREPVEIKNDTAYIGASREFGRLRLQARYGLTNDDFSDVPLTGGGVADQDFRDSDGTDFSLRADYALSPDTSLFISGIKRWRDFTRLAAGSPDRDFEAIDVLVGASFDVTRVVRGEVGVGYVTSEVEDPLTQDIDGLALNGVLEWFPTTLTTVRFDADRTVRESGIQASANVVRTSYGARIDHELMRNVIVGASAGRTDEDYEGIDRTDERISFGVGADWLVNRVVTVNAGLSRSEQDSSGSLRGRSFDQNVFTVGVTLRR
jgi:hypothetical protein